MSTDALTLIDLWNFARWLRVKPPRDASFEELYSFLLTKRKNLGWPTEDQIRLARELGIKVDPNLHVAVYIGGLITVASLKRGRDIIDANKALRQGNAIMYEGVPSRISRVAIAHDHWMVWLRPLVAGSNGGRPCVRVSCLADVQLATAEELEGLES